MKGMKSWKIKTNDYELGDSLGKGAAGEVFRLSQGSQICAYKKFIVPLLIQKDIDTIEKEINILRDLHHENTVSLLGVSLDPNGKDSKGNKLGIVIDYCENGSTLCLFK